MFNPNGPLSSRRTRSGRLNPRECLYLLTELAQSFRHMDIVTWSARHGHFTIHDQRRFEQILADFYGVHELTLGQLRNIRRQFCRQGYKRTRLSANSFRLTLRRYTPATAYFRSHNVTSRSDTGALRARSYSF